MEGDNVLCLKAMAQKIDIPTHISPWKGSDLIVSSSDEAEECLWAMSWAYP